MLPTYPYSFVDISSVLYKQPGNISVTILYSSSKWSVPKNLGKKKHNKKVQYDIKPTFSSVMTNVTIYGLICFRDDYTLQVLFSIRSEGVLPCTTVHQIIWIYNNS